LLRFGADLCGGSSDRRKKTANQNHARTKNRSPPETEKMPVHKNEREGGESECFLSVPIFRTMPGVVKMVLRSGIRCLLTPQEIFLETKRRLACAGLNLPGLVNQHA
jgi:hypothetical protein